MISKKTSAFIVAMFLTQICMAGFWETVKFWESPKRPETVIITGNFVKSRLLAELIQDEENCPLLLFSPESEKAGGQFYHLPDGKAASAEKMATLVQFLKFMNPKSVVVIGDEKYIGKTCASVLARCNKPVTYFRNSSNWASNATDAGKFFKISNLDEDYVAAISQVENRGHHTLARTAETRVVPVVRDRSTEAMLRNIKNAQSQPVMVAPQINTPQKVTPKANQKTNISAKVKKPANPDMNAVMEIDMDEPEIDVKSTSGAPQIIEQGAGK